MSLVCLQEPVAWVLGTFSLERRFKTLRRRLSFQTASSKPVAENESRWIYQIVFGHRFPRAEITILQLSSTLS